MFVCICVMGNVAKLSVSLPLLSSLSLLAALSMDCIIIIQKSKSMFVPDMRAILSDFELMGEGLVSSVEELAPHRTSAT